MSKAHDPSMLNLPKRTRIHPKRSFSIQVRNSDVADLFFISQKYRSPHHGNRKKVITDLGP